MIDWEATLKIFDLCETDRFPKTQKVVISCDICGKQKFATKHYHYRVSRRDGFYRCVICGNIAKSKACSLAAIKKWKDPEYIQKQKQRKHTKELKESAKKRAIKLWEDPEYIIKFKSGFDPDKARESLKSIRHIAAKSCSKKLKKLWQNDHYKHNMSQQSVMLWENDKYRDKVVSGLKSFYDDSAVLKECSERAKTLWKDPKYRDNWTYGFLNFLDNLSDGDKKAWSNRSSYNWLNPKYRKKIEDCWTIEKRQRMSEMCKMWWDDESRAAISTEMIEKWGDIEYRQTMITAFRDSWTDERRQAIRDFWTDERRQAARDFWTDERRQAASIRSQKLWDNPDYVRKMKLMASTPSSLERQFAYVLDEFGLDYDTQFYVGPYRWDFKIGNKLLDIQGDYWHTLPNTIIRDQKKAKHTEQKHSDLVRLYFWEHEFYQLEKVHCFINTHFAPTTPTSFTLLDVEFDNAVSFEDAKILFDNYHYKGSIGRGGHIYGARVNDILVAACIISSPTRNVPGGELTRFIIHPRYHIKNLGSWVLSRACKDALTHFDSLFTFADPNFNHTGTIYLASGWSYSGDTDKDYWYVGGGGWIMHKKTLWNRASRMSMSEREYAETFDYLKVWGLPKKKFVLEK